MNTINRRQVHDLASIFTGYGKEFLEHNDLCLDQYKAFNAIVNCRTSKLGGHLQGCDQCGHQHIAYNSCRNRHCNKCQYVKQLKWVDKLKSSLPVCSYFHMVFTIPQALHKLFYLNQRICYGLLFKASSMALQKAGSNPNFLGAQTGAVAVLHTWGEALTYHPHIHMIVPGGGLSYDGSQWIPSKGKKFFLPVKAISKIFRGILCSLLQKHLEKGTIKLPQDCSDFVVLKQKLYRKQWHVYSKKTMRGPNAVVAYLGKYTQRVAISNNRIKEVAQGRVTIRWKNYRKNLSNQLLRLPVNEFISRFLRHVLPHGFYRIRYYGLLASANCKTKKLKCIALLGKQPPGSLLEGLTIREILTIVTGNDPSCCPICKKGTMVTLKIIPQIREKPS